MSSNYVHKKVKSSGKFHRSFIRQVEVTLIHTQIYLILQVEVTLPKMTITKWGHEFENVKPSIILWFTRDKDGKISKPAFTGELTWSRSWKGGKEHIAEGRQTHWKGGTVLKVGRRTGGSTVLKVD